MRQSEANADQSIEDFAALGPPLWAEFPLSMLEEVVGQLGIVDPPFLLLRALFAPADSREQALARFVQHGPVDSIRDRYGRTALLNACGPQTTDLALKLIEAGADVNAVDGTGDNALVRAVWSGAPPSFVQQLIEAGAAQLEAALSHTLVPKTQPEVFRMLLAAGANPNGVDRRGMPLIVEAPRSGDPTFVRELLARGADVQARAPDGATALHRAAQEGCGLELLRELVAAGLDIDVRDGRGRTPLMAAALSRHDDLIGDLLALGAELEARDADGRTALWLAASVSRAGTGRVVSALLAAKANPNHKTSNGTPLHAAARGNSAAVAEALLAAGADVNAIEESTGRTPLSYATRRTRGILIAHGAKA